MAGIELAKSDVARDPADPAAARTAAGSGPSAWTGRSSSVGGSLITVYAISRDVHGNLVANVSATWSMTSTHGGVATSDLSPTSGASTVFTGHVAGDGIIRLPAAPLARHPGTSIAGGAGPLGQQERASSSRLARWQTESRQGSERRSVGRSRQEWTTEARGKTGGN